MRFVRQEPAITEWEEMKAKLQDEYLPQYFRAKYLPQSSCVSSPTLSPAWWSRLEQHVENLRKIIQDEIKASQKETNNSEVSHTRDNNVEVSHTKSNNVELQYNRATIEVQDLQVQEEELIVEPKQQVFEDTQLDEVDKVVSFSSPISHIEFIIPDKFNDVMESKVPLFSILPAVVLELKQVFRDISRCLLWTQRHHQTWPQIRTDILTKPIDLLMLNRLKETYCEIKEGELDAVTVVHSYEDGLPAGSHKTRLTALNVPPMGLFYPLLLVPDVYPPPPRSWFHDFEDMIEDTWHMEYPRRSDISDGLYPSMNVGLPMWDSYPVFSARPKKEEKVGIAEAVTSSILSTGRIDLQRKLFCSIQLIGGVALTNGLIPAVEESLGKGNPSG
uniref:Uncharacterized protein n=1 Tax=Fagus sylvatica TaxID=28930 RepID=A0A2N9IRV0_FAGSY